MTPQELKNSILQLAIQGKLVEQRPEEGTAEDLYQQIQAEKQALIKAGKIKKDRRIESTSLPPDDDIPFDIPESWKWVYLGGILNKLTDGTHRTPKYSTSGVKFVSVKDMSSGVLSLDNTKFITESEHAELFARCVPVKGDILLSKVGTTGVPAIVDTDEPFSLFVSVALLKYSHSCIDEAFLYYLIKSPLVQLQAAENTRGVGNKNWVLDAIAKTIVVLPPLAEQKRIVAKIEELLPLIDRYEKAWSRLEDFNKRFPGDMQKSILQMAIQGKLVEQRSEEGTGEELYRQIQAEKQALIKAGKIKKQKPLPEITEDEIPFEIPESWKWYRIGEVFNIVNGFTPLKSNPVFWLDGDIPWFTIEDVHRQGRFITTTEKFISKKALSKNTERIVPPDSVLLCCTASVGEYAYTKIPLTTNQQFNAFVTKPEFVNAVFPMYVYEFAKTLKDTLIRNAGKTTFNFLSVGKLSLLLFPLPPLAEQKRIVARLEELLPLCERLK